MTISAVEFGSLLCSRLCHDLLSPVGALNNGIELLADESDPAMRERCMTLLVESARVSANKLKFFRLAFGAGGGFGEEVGTRDARMALEGMLADRVTLNWMVDEELLPKGAVKAMLNLAMIAGDALVRGGQLDIGAEREGAVVEVVLRAAGTRVILDEEIASILVHGQGGDAISPRGAPAFLAHALVASAGGTIRLDRAEETILLGATLRII